MPMVARSPCRIARITALYGVPGAPVARQVDRVAEHQHAAGHDEFGELPDQAVVLGRCISTKRAWTSRNRSGTKSGAVMSASSHRAQARAAR